MKVHYTTQLKGPTGFFLFLYFVNIEIYFSKIQFSSTYSKLLLDKNRSQLGTFSKGFFAENNPALVLGRNWTFS